MKKLWILLLIAVMSSTMATPVPAAKAEPSTVVTHQELGNILVQLLGLNQVLPANPSDHEVFSALLRNGISPQGGWTLDQKVTRGDLARVVVQALGLEDEVKNPSDPNAWILVAKANGVPIDTVSQATGFVPTVRDSGNVIPNFGLSVDPLNRGTIASEIPDPALGLTIEEVRAVLSEVVVRSPAKVVTPN